ncbi:MAG: FAD-binding oxidoreductase [Actinobacteria bacterium]|nr:FAD-binding oxidoreductase [Actinomycetota bacterium]
MTTGSPRRRSWWGWGWADAALSDEECRSYGALIPGAAAEPRVPPSIADLKLPRPRVEPPDAFASISTVDPEVRAGHTYGKAYRDVVRALDGDVDAAPDFVVYPGIEGDVVALLDWASDANVAVIPYGAGSSVVGGTEYDGSDHAGVVSMDLSHMSRVLDVDRVSRAARLSAGILGPALEDALRPEGLTLRHFPQSFEFSTLGGWLATRSGGHYATNRTHIDDFVESMRVVTPTGTIESWRLPGSGAGPSPDRMFLGSEGTLGVITEAWMRLQDRPVHKRSTSATFEDAHHAFGAVRAVLQAGCTPANCRLLDPGEAGLSGASRAGEWVLVLGEESAHHPVDDALDVLTEIVRDAGGTVASAPTESDTAPATRDRAADSWRSSFIRMPYVRDAMARMSVISETFETATTWDRVEALYDDVRTGIGAAITEITGAPGLVNCRLTHSYVDGTAPYFTVIAASRPGSEVAMWDAIKAAAMEILTSHGATVTHHHAVGRVHRPGYDRQRPERFAAALGAIKAELDPAGICNPGVLI